MNIVGKNATLHEMMLASGRKARAAANPLALAPAETKNAALAAMAAEIRKDATLIEKENVADVAAAVARRLKASFIDRLTLTPDRIAAMARGVEEIAALADPVGSIIAESGYRSVSSASSTRAVPMSPPTPRRWP
jgi:glutamate-5-semialdehyde dehydrogenase